ncbi:tripartite tricarboxylate transporter permease [Neomoorella mulderi]|uniref:Tripartite tricarboxylate transporter TctA family protein n=1 Tax=Moorella mulderi DSM 14980 TaxID=1122241 RepID=A0A151ASY2_9FIRM|nr:tripartite tricarboxylate transporter permease [Moorella mulderi]KYH30683.1 tripartite tricarboxylate transporter TctA family protein [Moorella mulderi DSM 14980]
MDVLNHLFLGFSNAISPANILWCLIGVSLGTLVGVLPGLGPVATMAILIPLTVKLNHISALIMLAGIYYGSMYGSSTSAILVNIPGEPASVITSLDGYQMAKKGLAGPALGMSAIASFVAGTLSIVGLMFFAPLMSSLALGFGPAEMFALTFFALTILFSFTGKSLSKGLLSGCLGLLLATIGIDVQTGALRFTHNSPHLVAGISLVAVVVGLFAVPEILINAEKISLYAYQTHIGRVLPTKQDIIKCLPTMFRATVIGFMVGIIPGGTPAVAGFVSYDIERKIAKKPQTFGQGAIEGVAAAEGANNSATSGGLVPLLTLGIPPSAPIAVLLGAFLVHNITPGPLLFQEHPEVVWTLIASMYIGNVMLLVLNLPLVGMWARICRVPYPIIAPLIMVISFLGVYGDRNSLFDVWVMLIVGVMGYIMRKLEYPLVPLVLAFIVSPIMENALIQSLTLSSGSIMIFFSRPISLTLILLAMVSLAGALLSRKRQAKVVEVLGLEGD